MAATHSLDLESSSSQYASIADASCPNLEISGSQTYEGWIKTESTGTNKVIVAKGKASTAIYHQLAVNSSTEQLDVYIVGLTTNDFLRSNTVIQTGVWYHVAGVYDSSAGKLRIYINGELDKEVTAGGTASDTNSNFAIGCNFSGGSDAAASFFDGLLRNVRVWNVARTQAQIRADMNVDTPSVTTGLQGNWILNNAYTDSSGNGYTLTASGSPTFSTTYPDAIDLVENGTFTKKHKITIDNTKVAGSADLTDVPIVLTESNFLTDAFTNSQGQAIGSNYVGADANLSSYLAFDGADASTTITDSTGKSWTANGNAQLDTAQYKYGTASLLLDGTGDYISSADHADWDFTGDFTINVWYKSNARTNYSGIIATLNYGGGNIDGWRLATDYIGASNQPAAFIIYVNNVATTSLIGTSDINTGNWVRLNVTRSGTSLKLFVNGVQEASATVAGTIAAGGGGIMVGRNYDDLNQDYINGWIDEVAILNGTALTDNQIIEMYRGGADLRFSTDEAGEQRLAHEIVSWDTVASTAEVHVKVNTLSYNTDTDIYVHYDNASAVALNENEAFGKHQVWGENWEGVWHLNEASGTRMDASKNSYDLTDNNTVTSAAGKIGTAADFEATNSEYLSRADASCPNLQMSGSQTWFCIFKPESIGINHAIMSQRQSSDGHEKSIRIGAGDNKFYYFVYIGGTVKQVSTNETITAGITYFVVAKYDGSNISIQVDNGTKYTTSASGSLDDINSAFTLGRLGDYNGYYTDGLIDESRVYSGALSDDFITTLYNNQNSPSTFATASAVGGNASAFFMFL